MTKKRMEDVDCQSCGACCIEAGIVILKESDNVPKDLIKPFSGSVQCMDRHLGGRCKALEGVIGTAYRCSIYANRPSICKAFKKGSAGCLSARRIMLSRMKSPHRPRGYGKDWETTI